MTQISIVVPVYRSERTLRELHRRLTAVLERVSADFEIILVEDCGGDGSWDVIRELASRDAHVKGIQLVRNFGQHNALLCGVRAAIHEIVVTLDDDLQNPPEEIGKLIKKLLEGYDVVYGVREKRIGEPWFRVLPTMLAMRFITWMSDDVKLPLHSGDFRLISRRVRDAFAHLPEATRYLRGMIHWLGFKQIGIPYIRRGRTKGKTKVNFSLLLGFMFNAVFNFSIKPLRMFSFLGLGIIALTVLLAMVYLGMSFLTNPPRGITTVVMLLLMNLGVIVKFVVPP